MSSGPARGTISREGIGESLRMRFHWPCLRRARMDGFEVFALRHLCSQPTLQAQCFTAVYEHHYSPHLCGFKTLGETKQQQKLDMPENKTQRPCASDKWHTPFLLSQACRRGSGLWWPQLVLSLALRPLCCISCKQGTVPPQR